MKNILLLLLCIAMLGTACNKTTTTVFEVTDQNVSTDLLSKDNIKTELTLVTNAWSDLFNENMPADLLNQLVETFFSTNDRGIIVDRALRHMLNRNDLQLPDNTEMRADLDKFCAKTYQKFYHRSPNPFEAFKLKQLIQNDNNLRPTEIYMAFLTSDEYARN